MTSRPQSPRTWSLLEQCAPEILECIAVHTVADTFLGPPNDLLSLLCTSKALHYALAPENNSNLYARIFEIKFDLAAPKRRLTQRWYTLTCLSHELRMRFGTLRRIRSQKFADGPELLQDLWTCVFMLLESDTKNMAQLVEWAKVVNYLQLITRKWLHGNLPQNFARDRGALVFCILSDTIREDDLTPQWCGELSRLAHFYITSGFKYSTYYAPSDVFRLPLYPHQGYHPRDLDTVRSAELYSHKLPVVIPPLTSSALTIFALARDAAKPRFSGGRGPDYSASERCDDDWSRLVSCYDPYSFGSALRGKLFTPGNLSAHWNGRVLVPTIGNYNAMLSGNMSPASVPLIDMRVSFDLKEHHCFTNTPLAPGVSTDGVGDDVLNAWIPRGVLIEQTEEACSLYDPVTKMRVRYETYKPNEDPHYSSQPNGQIETSWTPGTGYSNPPNEDSSRVTMDSDASDNPFVDDEPEPSYIDNDQEWEDTVEHLTTGIYDILVTGEYVETYNTTIQTFDIVGRVRSWDGLVVLLRRPRANTNDNRISGDWIFRGYIHRMDWLIGRWRETHTPVDQVGWECGFMVEKQAE